MWWKTHGKRMIAIVSVIIVLAFAFWYGGDAPGLRGWNVDAPEQNTAAETKLPTEDASQTDQPEDEPKTEPAKSEEPPTQAAASSSAQTAVPNPHAVAPEKKPDTPENKPPAAETKPKPAEDGGMEINPETGKDAYQTDPVPEGRPVPVEPQDVVVTDEAMTCTISISCKTILDHMDWLDAEKTGVVPEDGWLLEATDVTFYEGESVFNVLQRTCKQQKIHMEFENVPLYNSAYVEGIGNLYEFDCGELSGWMYEVNGWFPNYGCSRYQLKDGDVINWVYTCDLGKDVGGGNALG